MLDVLYIAITIVVFGLRLAYVHACEVLGHEPVEGEDRP